MKVRPDKPQPVVMLGGNQSHPYRRRLGAVPTLSSPSEPVPFLLLPEMVAIDAATFIMGKFDSVYFGPEREVSLPAFLIGKYPITNRGWQNFLKDERGSAAIQESRQGYIAYLKTVSGEDVAKLLNDPRLTNHPVVWVSWHDANAYCRWLTEITGHLYRLPKNVEWEYVVRGKELRTFPWGKDWDAMKVSPPASFMGGTAPVNAHPEGASVQPNGARIFDLLGNVWEWMEDDGYKSGDDIQKLLRGGSDIAPFVYFYASCKRFYNAGFRVVV